MWCIKLELECVTPLIVGQGKDKFEKLDVLSASLKGWIRSMYSQMHGQQEAALMFGCVDNNDSKKHWQNIRVAVAKDVQTIDAVEELAKFKINPHQDEFFSRFVGFFFKRGPNRCYPVGTVLSTTLSFSVNTPKSSVQKMAEVLRFSSQFFNAKYRANRLLGSLQIKKMQCEKINFFDGNGIKQEDAWANIADFENIGDFKCTESQLQYKLKKQGYQLILAADDFEHLHGAWGAFNELLKGKVEPRTGYWLLDDRICKQLNVILHNKLTLSIHQQTQRTEHLAKYKASPSYHVKQEENKRNNKLKALRKRLRFTVIKLKKGQATCYLPILLLKEDKYARY